MPAEAMGRLDWGTSRTREGHREHWIDWLVSSLVTDGPFDIYYASGLPMVGSPWVYGGMNDPYAYCAPDWKIHYYEHDHEPNYLWVVHQTFTTVPRKRCQDTTIEDPLQEPDDISGTFVKYQQEATRDRHGKPLKYSNHQMIRGKLVERDRNRPTVRIKRNVATLPLTMYASMIDHLNDSMLWGMEPRCVKLSNVTYAKRTYAVCSHFYEITYDFDIRWNTFDEEIQDEGTTCLIGTSPGSDKKDDPMDPDGIDPDTGLANKLNPKNFEAYLDILGAPQHCLLDGNGMPWDGTGDPTKIDVEHYDEANLLLLDIPTSL